MANKAKCRGKGTGTLVLRGRTYTARWTVGGKVYVRSTGTGVRADAERILADYVKPFTERTERDQRAALVARFDSASAVVAEREAQEPGYTFAEAWTAFDRSQSRPRSGAATFANYEQWFDLFAEWVEANHPEVTELRHVTPEIARDYAAHLLGRVRGTTFNRHVNALALVWRHVAADFPAESKLGENPFAWDRATGKGIRRVKLTHAERPHSRRDLTPEEVHKLLSASSGELRALVALGFYTGLRLGDCATLDWGNVDRVARVIVTRSAKTDTATETPIHPALARILAEEIGTADTSGPLLPELAALYRSGMTGRVKLVRMVAALFASVGIETSHKGEGETRARPDCGFHSLRHAYVTQLARLGATVAERQRLAGHGTAAMTEHYTHEDGRAVLALPDVTEEPPTPEELRFRAFRSSLDGMGREELERARDHLAGLLAR